MEESSFSDILSDYITLRKTESNNSKISPKMLTSINALSFEFELIRLFGSINGVLIDREHENKIQELTQDNEKLVNTVSEQKEKLNDLIDKAVDTKNIRGIGMISYNIFQCDDCKRKILAEEVDSHKCKTVKEYKIIDSTLWVSDGEKWYPLKLPLKLIKHNIKVTGE